MDQIIAEPCSWDSEFGFQHQQFCNHTCHSNVTGFGHIFVCCGRMVVGGDIRCSSRCQRRHGRKESRESAVDPPDCPHCGPWRTEGQLYTSLSAVEWWFHLFALLPLTDEVKFRIQQLRLHLADILTDMPEAWARVYAETDSVHALRAALKREWDGQRDSSSASTTIPERALPCSTSEAENWYVPETEPTCSPGSHALDKFLDARAGALDFSTEGDAAGELRLDMIAHIKFGLSAFAWPPETDLNSRRLLTLFDRDLFRDHVLGVSAESVPGICESDRQMMIYAGEKIVAEGKGYWTSLEDLAGCGNAHEMTREELKKAFGWLVASSMLKTLRPVFDWLGTAAEGGVEFKIGEPTMFRSCTYGSARELLKKQEALSGGLLFWTLRDVETFLEFAEEVRDQRPRPDTSMLGGLWVQSKVRQTLSNKLQVPKCVSI